MDKYEKLTEDLKVALEKAKEIAMKTDDGGTCNFDCCIIRLPRWREELVIKSIQLSGTVGHKWHIYGSVYYAIRNPILCQGNKNSIQAEVITEELSKIGYECWCYQQAD